MNKSARLLALLGAAVIAASACTNGGGASTAPSAAAPTSAATAAASAAASAEASASAAAFDPSTVDPKSLLGMILSSGKIRISTDPNYKPYSFLNTATNTYEGFDTSTAEETVKRLSAKLGKEIKIDWQTPGWDLITAGSWGGRWDLSIGSMSVTEDRAKVVDFVDPYYYDTGAVAVPKASTVQSLSELEGGKTFCVGTATTYEQWLNGTLKIVDPNIQKPPTTAPDKITALPTDNSTSGGGRRPHVRWPRRQCEFSRRC